jgi:DNA topoisomerase I
MTNLERLQNTGIRRTGTPRNFRYLPADGHRITADDLERIKRLRIPPAWKRVAINQTANGRLQAVGRDVAGRWQYLYHASHTRTQETRKFRRLIKFAEGLPKMRKAVAHSLKQPGLERERVLACVLRILSTCFMRPGSQVYASEHGSYGVATLRPRHVKVKGDLVEFDFPGKSGVRQVRQIRDRQVAKVIREMLRHPGAEVFKFRNGDGLFVDVKRRHINVYIKEVMGESFSAKDFRTWAGTLICACALARAGADESEKLTSRKKKIVAAVKETAETLGNTPAVCRGSYICPEILDGFEKGRIIDNYFKTLEDFIAFRGRTLHSAERALLKFLKRSAT